MPPKRKALEPANQNVASSPNSGKKAKTTASDAASGASQNLDALLQAKLARRSGRWSKISGSKNLDADYWTSMKDPKHAYEFMCVCDPSQGDDEDDDEYGEDEDEDGGDKNKTTPDKQVCDEGKTCPCDKTAASLPSHQYTITRAGLSRHAVAGGMMTLRIPDAFAMYTFNDHMAYGALEVVQNLIQDFDEALKAGEWREAWAVVEGLALFMLFGRGGMMSMADDGEMIRETAALIARMAPTALAMLEAEGQLTENSDVRSLGWMITLYLKVANEFRDMSLLQSARPSKAKTFKFSSNNLDLYLLSYARRCGVTVPDVDVSKGGDITMPKAGAKDPWAWNKNFADYKRNCVVPPYAYRGRHRMAIGGDGLDISTWSSAERKENHFKNIDPIPDDAMKKLKEGLILTLR